MFAKEYLRGIRTIRRRINLLIEQIKRDELLASGVSAIRYDKERVQTSGTGDRMADIVASIVDTTEELKNDIKILQEYERRSIKYLVQLKPEHERVLTMYYYDDTPLRVIASTMGYSEKYIYELRDAAIEELDEVLNNSEQF